MGRVLVAGSINMDVVATADPHWKIGETAAGKEVLYFPGGGALKHDPEKCEAVFPRDKRGTRLRGDHAQSKS